MVGIVHSGGNKANGTEKFIHYSEFAIGVDVHYKDGEEHEEANEQWSPLVQVG